MRLKERIAIVTGAGGGLGRVYALELARRGAKVVVNDLGGARDGSGEGSAAPADQVVSDIKAAGGYNIAQDEESCVVYGMPREVIERGAHSEIAPLGMIPERICKALSRVTA